MYYSNSRWSFSFREMCCERRKEKKKKGGKSGTFRQSSPLNIHIQVLLFTSFHILYDHFRAVQVPSPPPPLDIVAVFVDVVC